MDARPVLLNLGEPGRFWAGSSMTVHDIPADYDATIGAMHRGVRANQAGAAGDPERAAQIIVQAVKLSAITRRHISCWA